MRIANILFLKEIREGKIIDIILIFFLVLFSVFKNSLIPYSLIYLVFINRINALIWDNENEKYFYLQFESKNLKRIISVKHFFLFLEFNFIYTVVVTFLSITDHDFIFNKENWILMNLFIQLNQTFGIIYNFFFIQSKFFLDWLIRLVSFTAVNLFFILLIYSLKMSCKLIVLFYLISFCLLFCVAFYSKKKLIKKITNTYLND
jgi:hypothetical protein